MNLTKTALCGFLLLMIAACNDSEDPGAANPLAINEIVSSNDGVSIDETGQPEDLIELVNLGSDPLRLNDYAIADAGSAFIVLPDFELAPGGYVQLWASDDPTRGSTHLPFKLSASGDRVSLRDAKGEVFQQVDVPALTTNQSFSRFPSGSGPFARCRYATPGRSNGTQCEPNAIPPLQDDVKFAEFPATQWPSVAPQNVGINELAILPAQFIELKNFSGSSVNLANYRLVLAAYPPTAGLPAFDDNGINLPATTLAPGEVADVSIIEEQVAPIVAQAFNEGVAVLFNRQTRQPADVVPFMHWPAGRSLARQPASPYRWRFCENNTPGVDGGCDETEAREIGDRTRGIYTPGDFARLAQGSGLSNEQSVKFVIDLANQNTVHFLSSRDWPLHYTFVRQTIDMDSALNRCDAQENQLFNIGWSQFSAENYFNNTTRRYHLGTLTHHSNAGLRNVELPLATP